MIICYTVHLTEKKRFNNESFVGESLSQWQEKLSRGVFCITKMYAVICLCEIVFVMSSYSIQSLDMCHYWKHDM